MTTDTDTYRIEERPHGRCIFGAVPATEMVDILKQCERDGYELLDQRIADALDATLVATSREGQRAWREKLDLEVRQ